MKIIGLTGVAKAGKDTFYRGLVSAYPNMHFARLSVGDIIRAKLCDFIFNETGITVWSCTPQEKELIRPILAWYGDVKRKQSQGRFFLDRIEEMCEMDSVKKCDYAVITDVRFKEFLFDEPDWIHSKSGTLIHIKRIIDNPNSFSPTDGYSFAPPANDLERDNDPKVLEHSDIKVIWPTFLPSENFDERVVQYVKNLEPLSLKPTQTIHS